MKGISPKEFRKGKMKAPSNDNTWYTLTLSEFVNLSDANLIG